MIDDMYKLDEIRRLITRVAGSERGIEKFMLLLAQTDWRSVCKQDLRVCTACSGLAPYTSMCYFSSKIKICCPTCYQKSVDGYDRQCDMCGLSYFTHSISKNDMCIPCHTEREGRNCLCCSKRYWPVYGTVGLCSSCRDTYSLDVEFCRKLYFQVHENVQRALARRLPATLTIDEWVRTLLDFKFYCAYCLVKPYEQLEHFTPLFRDGGTTKGNCVPACDRCNKLKHTEFPDWVRAIPRETLERVRAYLEQFCEPRKTPYK